MISAHVIVELLRILYCYVISLMMSVLYDKNNKQVCEFCIEHFNSFVMRSREARKRHVELPRYCHINKELIAPSIESSQFMPNVAIGIVYITHLVCIPQVHAFFVTTVS